MENYIAITFESDAKAFDGLHELWKLNDRGDITVHGAAVIHRDKYGLIDVATKETYPGLRTAAGIGLGALLGALAGPVGAAAGATAAAAGATAAAGAGVGAATGALIGGTADVVKADEHEEFARQAGFTMAAGQSAVLAEVSEDWTSPVDTTMGRMGGIVFRRSRDAVRDDSIGWDYPLYPYDYQPVFYN
ncbi:MAG: hypothetical protein JO036_02955 [Candidatus Eremiobacteraeota bacterium]|nr:hypothetical protein [Candidatus Eremiobacteraeota bacterium]